MRGSLIARIVRARWPVRQGPGFDSQGEAAMGKMQGRVAIVTGASRGIGQAIAELLAREGAKVVCVARTLNEGDHPLKGSLGSTVAVAGYLEVSSTALARVRTAGGLHGPVLWAPVAFMAA